jgi:hypothetical protein
MKRLVWTTLAILAVSGRPADSHQLDEYLQATRIAAAADRVSLEIGLTAGVAVAARVFAMIDRDGDGRVSSAEFDSYARRVLNDVAVSVDGQPVEMALTRSDCPRWDQFRAGAGTIRIDAVADVRLMPAGRHRIRVINRHAPDFSAYLVNALVPSDPAITITAQRRDVLQHGIDLDLDVARAWATVLWTIAIFGAFAALGIYQVTASWRASMKRQLLTATSLVLAASVWVFAQGGGRPMSPEGAAQTQVLGKWVKGDRPAFTLGRETYQGGKWIEITYGRPLQRGRDLFGSGQNYGKAALDVGAPGFPAPPVWRAGANMSTRLKTEAGLTFGAKTVPAGEYSLFIDLNSPTAWTLIVSNWAAQAKFNPEDKTALWGAYGYTPDKDVARIPMKVDTLPFAVDQLTWSFFDMTNDGGRIALMWGKSMASAPFKATEVR